MATFRCVFLLPTHTCMLEIFGALDPLELKPELADRVGKAPDVLGGAIVKQISWFVFQNAPESIYSLPAP